MRGGYDHKRAIADASLALQVPHGTVGVVFCRHCCHFCHTTRSATPLEENELSLQYGSYCNPWGYVSSTLLNSESNSPGSQSEALKAPLGYFFILKLIGSFVLFHDLISVQRCYVASFAVGLSARADIDEEYQGLKPESCISC